MFIINAEEFNHQARNSSNFSGKVYRKKIFTPGVIYSIKQKEAAIQYCRNWMKKNPSFLCILVEDTHQLQVWYEQLTRSSTSKRQNSLAESGSSLLKSKNLPIDRNFVTRCEQKLTDSIGPIAKIIVKKIISQNSQCNREQFILKLIEALPKKTTKDLEEQLKQLLNEL